MALVACYSSVPVSSENDYVYKSHALQPMLLFSSFQFRTVEPLS